MCRCKIIGNQTTAEILNGLPLMDILQFFLDQEEEKRETERERQEARAQISQQRAEIEAQEAEVDQTAKENEAGYREAKSAAKDIYSNRFRLRKRGYRESADMKAARKQADFAKHQGRETRKEITQARTDLATARNDLERYAREVGGDAVSVSIIYKGGEPHFLVRGI